MMLCRNAKTSLFAAIGISRLYPGLWSGDIKMLMRYHGPMRAAASFGRTIAAIARHVSLGVHQLYKALKNRRDIAGLADWDDRMLADIGLTRSDLRAAMGDRLWRDPTTLLARQVEAARSDGTAGDRATISRRPYQTASNAARLLASAGGALAAIYWLDLGAAGFFIAVALGFVAYAALTACAAIRVKDPPAVSALERPVGRESKGEIRKMTMITFVRSVAARGAASCVLATTLLGGGPAGAAEIRLLSAASMQ